MIFGHCSVVVTERYAHLSPKHLLPADFHRVEVDLPTTRIGPTQGPKRSICNGGGGSAAYC